MPVLTRGPVTTTTSHGNRFYDDLLDIDPVLRLARLDGVPLTLRAKEYELLCALAQRAGAVASRAQLLAQVWDYSEEVRTRTLDVHISALRRHLAGSSLSIETVRGKGYRLRGPGTVEETSSTRSRKRLKAVK